MKVKKLIPELETIINENQDSCAVCELHELFSKKYKEIVSIEDEIVARSIFSNMITIPLCPKCDKQLTPCTDYGYNSGTVGSSNTVDEAEDMQYCQLWHCEDCKQDYAMMPIAIDWNANHDILYTGGHHYLTDDEEKLVRERITSKIKSSVDQFCRGIKDPKDDTDKQLDSSNLNLWIKRDITAGLAEVLYELGLKK